MVSSKIKQHNINALSLIRNKDFYFVNENNVKIQFYVPSFDDYLADTNLSMFIGLLELDKEKFKEMKIKNNYDLLIQALQNKLYLDEILFTLHKYIPNINYKNGGFFVDEEYMIPAELDFVVDVWRVALGLLSIDQFTGAAEADPELDEFEKRIREKEAKIKKIKEKTESGNFDLDRIIITVMKEFGLTMSQLLEMNLFTIFWYYRYALRVSNYFVESIAYGNGLIKKHKHFAE